MARSPGASLGKGLFAAPAISDGVLFDGTSMVIVRLPNDRKPKNQIILGRQSQGGGMFIHDEHVHAGSQKE